MFGDNVSGDLKLNPLLFYHSENPRVLKNIAKSSLPIVWKGKPKAWVTHVIFQDWFFHIFIPETEKKKNIACTKHPIQYSFLARENSRPAPINRWLSSQCQSSASATEYYIVHPTYGLGNYSGFQEILFISHFFQAVDASDKSGTTLQQFWKNYNIYKAIKNIDFSWHEIVIIIINEL